jgi:hypothetical protein
MVPDYTSIAAAILLGIAGQIALKSAANGSATVIAQFLNPLTIIGSQSYLRGPQKDSRVGVGLAQEACTSSWRVPKRS